MSVAADNDVVMHGDAERLGDVDNLARYIDVGARRSRIAGRMIVQQPWRRVVFRFYLIIHELSRALGTVTGGSSCPDFLLS